ncbi:MAG TPA: rhomboid family protein [Chthoniobacteraceae bacterium]|nr:rhomboid family protein [Chthoniobacteraceae bacterium]
MSTAIPSTLAAQRCHFHIGREAVARCPECKRFFCRECITEHDDRLICASCLQKLAVKKSGVRGKFGAVGGVFLCVLGILVAWVFFYSMGQLVLMLPSNFHEGTVWHAEGGE